MTDRKRVVLVGAGHAHPYTLKHARIFAEWGYEFVLLAPGDFWYSGLPTGMLGGHYPRSLDRIDVSALATGGGGRFVKDCVTRLDWRNRTMHLASGPPVPYNALSFNLGSVLLSLTVSQRWRIAALWCPDETGRNTAMAPVWAYARIRPFFI